MVAAQPGRYAQFHSRSDGAQYRRQPPDNLQISANAPANARLAPAPSVKLYRHRPQIASKRFAQTNISQKTISWYALASPKSNCFINEFLSALTSLFARPHSFPVSRATETSHRIQGRGQDKDKRRTRPGHRAGPQSPATEFRGAAKTRTRGGQEEDKAQPQRTRAQ